MSLRYALCLNCHKHMQNLKALSYRLNDGSTLYSCIMKCIINRFYKFTLSLSLDPRRLANIFCQTLNYLLRNCTVKPIACKLKKPNHSRQAEKEMITDSFLTASPTISYLVSRLSHGRLKQNLAQGM